MRLPRLASAVIAWGVCVTWVAAPVAAPMLSATSARPASRQTSAVTATCAALGEAGDITLPGELAFLRGLMRSDPGSVRWRGLFRLPLVPDSAIVPATEEAACSRASGAPSSYRGGRFPPSPSVVLVRVGPTRYVACERLDVVASRVLNGDHVTRLVLDDSLRVLLGVADR